MDANEQSSRPLLAYLQLLRIPNVFTAIANVAMGFLITHTDLQPLGPFVLLVLASCCLYTAGMVLNDVVDVEKDRVERAHRPIPSGQVPLRVARRLGFFLLLGGLVLGGTVSLLTQSLRPGIVALALAGCIVLYDTRLKTTAWGPIAMGGCRTLNVLLGMSVATEAATGQLRNWVAGECVVAIGIGIFIAGVTWFARTEARQSSRGQLTAALGVLVAGLGVLASLPEWGLLNVSSARWYALWAVLTLLIGQVCIAAIREPTPTNVQLAVKRCLLCLILLDAAVCFGVRGPVWAAAIMLLLVPQWLLGRFVYST